MGNDTTMPNVAPVPRLALTVIEASQALSLSPRSVEELARMGQLRVVRVGRRVLVPVKSIEVFLAVEQEREVAS